LGISAASKNQIIAMKLNDKVPSSHILISNGRNMLHSQVKNGNEIEVEDKFFSGSEESYP
jgi:hypothetical protein